MKALVRVECIGDNHGLSPEGQLWWRFLDRLTGGTGSFRNRYWAAEITGLDPRYKFARRFLLCKKDYRQANSVGTRGVYAYYELDEGKVYEVSSPRSWNRTDRYFCRVGLDGDIITMAEGEVLAWLKSRSVSTSTMPPGNG